MDVQITPTTMGVTRDSLKTHLVSFCGKPPLARVAMFALRLRSYLRYASVLRGYQR